MKAYFLTISLVYLNAISIAGPLDANAKRSAIASSVAQLVVNSVSYTGDGCPLGTVGEYTLGDSFTFVFAYLVAQTGNGEPATEKTKSCQLNLSLQLPDGVQYTVVDVGTRGYVGLDAGVTATQTNTYSLAGGPSITKQSTFAGPVDSSYARSDSVSLDTAVWSACGGTSDLNIVAEVAVEGSSETSLGSIAADSIDGRFGATVALAWRKC